MRIETDLDRETLVHMLGKELVRSLDFWSGHMIARDVYQKTQREPERTLEQQQGDTHIQRAAYVVTVLESLSVDPRRFVREAPRPDPVRFTQEGE